MLFGLFLVPVLSGVGRAFSSPRRELGYVAGRVDCRTVGLPEGAAKTRTHAWRVFERMSDMRAYVAGLDVVDVHEHHIPEILERSDVGLLDLFQQSYPGWTQARPYPLPSESRSEDPMLAGSAQTTWEALAPFLEGSGSNAFVRSLVQALSELYELDSEGVTRANWKDLDAEVRRRHRRPEWRRTVLKRARVAHVITDVYTDPLLDARAAFGPHYNSVARINSLAFGWHSASRDHNGISAFDLAARLGVSLESFDDFVGFLETFVDTLGARHQVALKNALAYDRDLRFDEPDEALARQAWGRDDPNAAERKAFGDFVVDRLCALAGERGVPVQMHLGTAILRGSHPMHVAPLIERHPRTRFLLMHFAYPWSADLLGMAFVYRNIWLDLTWSFLLSPSHFKRAFHEAIENLPNESRMMLGGDNWHVEETFGAFRTARRLIGEVLAEKVSEGYFGRRDAERLAVKVFSGNAREFFSLAET